MNGRSYILALSLALFFLPEMFSQTITQTIRGTVTDKNSKAPLIGANIILLDSNPLVGAVSDTNGDFRIDKVAVGRQGIKISYIGYHEQLINNLNLTSGKELVINIELEEKIMKSHEVVISAGAVKTLPQNSMTTVSSRSFSVEETERYAGCRLDIARMAANFAGVSGKSDARNDIVIRGNSPSGLLWRLDGIDIPNPNHFAAFGTSGGPVSMLKNSLLRNSDFLTGAFPAEYGNAVSGVFDLKMINGNNQKHEFTTQIAFNGVDVGAEGPISKAKGSSYLFDYRISFLGLFKLLGMKFGTGDAVPQYQDACFKLNFPRTKIGTVSIFGFGGLSNIAFLNSKRDTNRTRYDFYTSDTRDIDNRSEVGVIGLSNTYLISSSAYSTLTLSAAYHHFYTSIDSILPATRKTTPFEANSFNETRLSVSWIINKKFNAHHSIRMGIMFTGLYYDLFDSVLVQGTSSFKFKLNYRGFSSLSQPFFQWQYKITDNLTLNQGLHFMYYFYNHSKSIEPRLGVRWEPEPGHIVSLGYGLHSQMIPVSSFFSQVKTGNNEYEKVNDHLGFIRSHHFVAGYEWMISDVMRLKLEGYYQLLYHVPVNGIQKDYFSVLNLGVDFSETQPDTLVGGGNGKNYGLELTVERFLRKGFYFLFTGSLYDSKYTGSDHVERNTVFNGGYTVNLLAGKEFVIGKNWKRQKRQKTLYADIRNSISGNMRYIPLDEDASALQGKAVYNTAAAYSEKYPFYMTTDIKIAFKMNARKFSIEWALEVSNLFNRKNVYRQNYNPNTGQTYYTYQYGRMFIPSYRITF